MPELPDVTIYLEALASRIVGATLDRTRVATPFLVRTVTPPLSSAHGRRVTGLRRVGKRIAMALDDDALFLVIHLMIAGRFRWRPVGAKPPGKIGLAAFDFSTGTLLLTEAGTKRRAALHVVEGETGLHELDPGGLEPLAIDLPTFAAAVVGQRHTLKRVLTDPHVLAGIGNAYSDEILHRARLSPLKMAHQLDPASVERLYAATQTTLHLWVTRLRADTGDRFPEKVTAFRDGMAVHGRFGQPCPDCATPVQRIVHAENETNYCPTCQTGGRLLADRSLSKLLHDDWPKTIEEWENRRQ